MRQFILTITFFVPMLTLYGESLGSMYIGLMSQPYVRTSSTSGSPFDYTPGVGLCATYEPSTQWSHKFELLFVPYHSPATERRPEISTLGFRVAFVTCFNPIHIDELSSSIGIESGVQLSIDEYLNSGEIGSGSISIPFGVCWSVNVTPVSVSLAPRVAFLVSNWGLDASNAFLWFVVKAAVKI